MSNLPCPDANQLQALILGLVERDAAAALEKHLAECTRCSDTLKTVPLSDAMVEALRRRAQPREERAEVAPWAERVRALAPAGGDAKGDQEEVAHLLAPPEMSDEIGRLGGYRVLRVLGVGGMGIVFEAEDPQLERLLALKVMRPSLAAFPTYRERFLREARAAAAIDHDHIVAIHQVGQERGVPFLAMPRLKGESLRMRLQRERRLPVPDVLRLGREIAEGLAAAHERGLLHRDIKPDNIWLDSRGRVKILDFGLARSCHAEKNLTQSGDVLGTPNYMAPEQALGRAVDTRCDLFSLGAVLYRMATGEPPFTGDSAAEVLVALAQSEPASPSVSTDGIPPALDDLILELLAKDPAERPHSSHEVAARLAEMESQAAATVKRRKSPFWLRGWASKRRSRKQGSRTKTALGAGLLAIVMLAAGAVIHGAAERPSQRSSRGAAPLGDPPSLPSDAKNNVNLVQIPANQEWTDTGIDLHGVMELSITAKGRVEAASATETRLYYHQVPPGGREETFGYFPHPSLPGLALVGRVGNGQPFLVGEGCTVSLRLVEEQNQSLFLGINDDVVTDNAGAWSAVITARR
jgi:serine/threonine protein kinase